MPFHRVEQNLRESFRVLATGKTRGDILELPGLTIASSGVTFQMFNAAFLSGPVATQDDLETRLRTARQHFKTRGIPWSFWVCEDFLALPLHRRLSRTFEAFGLRIAAEMPGMVAESIDPPDRRLPPLEFRLVDSLPVLNDFRAIGATCFHVPIGWFSEVFDEKLIARQTFICRVGYSQNVPVATAAGVVSEGAIGIYNVATLPAHRGRGYGEAITRHAIAEHSRTTGLTRAVLQSTAQGLRIYERMGFRAVTRILVYNSR